MRRTIVFLFLFLPFVLIGQETEKKHHNKHKVESIKKKIIAKENELLKLNMEQNALIDEMISESDKPEKVQKLSVKIKKLKEKIEVKKAEEKELKKQLVEVSPQELEESDGVHGEWMASLDWEQFVFKRKKDKFRGHWAGLEIGLNGFLTPENKLEPDGEAAFMETERIQSWALGVNILEFNLPIRRPNFGITTGVGFEWNHYRFAQNFIFGQQDGKIQAIEPEYKLTRNQLNTVQVNVPLLLELQFPANAHHQFHIGAGPMVSYVLSAKQKVRWDIDTQEIERIHKDGLLLNKFRYGATVRVGFSYFHLYANYSMVPLFEEDKGPELHPFSVGLVLINW